MKTIQLSRGLVALVDDDDYENIARHKWYAVASDQAQPRFYAIRQDTSAKKPTTIYMHRFIMMPSPKLEIDHINGDGLDNRRVNLRACTRSQNNANRKNNPKSSTGYRGVYQWASSKSYRSMITINKKNVELGRFRNPEDAARAYDAAALAAFGEFATLNFPDEASNA